jgi:hypothetical protein
LLRGCLTALVVGVVLVLMRRAGPRVGGLAAAMPTTSVPALAWAFSEQGPAFAAAAAAAALLTTALTGLIALLYAHAAPRLTPVRALGAATLPVVVLAVLVTGAGSSHLATAVVASVLVLLTCRRLMPGAPASSGAPFAVRRSNLLMTAAVAGGFTAWIGSIAPSVPALLCGAVAAIPVIGLSTTVTVHGQGGPAAAVRFLHGYQQGLWAKVAFLALLAALLPQCPAPVAWAAAAAGGVALALAAQLRGIGARAWRIPRQLQWI